MSDPTNGAPDDTRLRMTYTISWDEPVTGAPGLRRVYRVPFHPSNEAWLRDDPPPMNRHARRAAAAKGRRR